MSEAAVYTVSGNLGCGSPVLAATTTLAPSRAAGKAMASPMPQLAPVMNRVFPFRLCIVFHFAQGTEVTDVLFCDYLTFRLEITVQQNRERTESSRKTALIG